MLDDAAPRLGRPPRYTIDQVLDAAERLPYDRLTMKSLADELDLVPSALYRYVRDRDDLVEQLTARLSGLLPLPDESLPWDEWLTSTAVGIFDLVLAHPVLSDVRSWVTFYASQGDSMISAWERVYAAAGIAPTDAIMAHTAANNLALALASGQVRLQPISDAGTVAAGPNDHDPAWRDLDTRRALAGGVALVVDGVRRRLEHS